MRALGITSDKDIIRTCLLDLEKNESYVDLFIPSVHDASKVFNQESALNYIKTFTKRNTVSGVYEILSDYFLPHIGEVNFLDKAFFVGYMVSRLLKVYNNEEKPTDRDNFKFKRVELPGTLIYDLFREYYLIQKRSISRKIDEEYYYHRGEYKEDSVQTKKQQSKQQSKDEANKYKNNFTGLIELNYKQFFKDREVESGFKKAFKGNWGSEAHTKRLGVVQDLNRLSWNTFISHLRKINLPLDASAKVVGPRHLHGSQWGFIDPLDTPDGGNIGLHKHLAISTYITSGSSGKEMMNWLRANTTMKLKLECSPEYLYRSSKVIVNGNWVGVIDEPIELVKFMKLYRRNAVIPVFTSISFDYEHSEVYIYTDAGRLTRPVYYIENGRESFNRDKTLDGATWEQIVSGFSEKSDTHYSTKKNKLYNLIELYSNIVPNITRISRLIHHLCWASWEIRSYIQRTIRLHVTRFRVVKVNKPFQCITPIIKCVSIRWALF